MRLIYTSIGPIISQKYYFVTRHPLLTLNMMNPFASLEIKFWINYFLLYIILILVSTCSYWSCYNKLTLKQIIMPIISLSNSYWSLMLKSGVMFPCLISFTFFTFSHLYGVDLASVVVGTVEALFP